jgi:ethanolamine utilization protein EutQ (cupin superfamily)
MDQRPGRGGKSMEVGPGIFVTAASADEWQPHAYPAGEIIVLCTGDGLRAGLWRSVPAITPQQMQWTAPSREVKIVLAGTSRVEIKDGPTLELKAGDVASLPRGASATWSFSPDYQEMWVLEEDRAGN